MFGPFIVKVSVKEERFLINSICFLFNIIGAFINSTSFMK